MALNRVSPIVFSPTEHALVDLDGLVSTADLFNLVNLKLKVTSQI